MPHLIKNTVCWDPGSIDHVFWVVLCPCDFVLWLMFKAHFVTLSLFYREKCHILGLLDYVVFPDYLLISSCVAVLCASRCMTVYVGRQVLVPCLPNCSTVSTFWSTTLVFCFSNLAKMSAGCPSPGLYQHPTRTLHV